MKAVPAGIQERVSLIRAVQTAREKDLRRFRGESVCKRDFFYNFPLPPGESGMTAQSFHKSFLFNQKGEMMISRLNVPFCETLFRLRFRLFFALIGSSLRSRLADALEHRPYRPRQEDRHERGGNDACDHGIADVCERSRPEHRQQHRRHNDCDQQP